MHLYKLNDGEEHGTVLDGHGTDATWKWVGHGMARFLTGAKRHGTTNTQLLVVTHTKFLVKLG